MELPPVPDISEPIQEAEIRETRNYPKATQPGLCFAYHMPERNTPEYFAMGAIDQMLLQGNDALLHQALVQDAGLTASVSGGINAFLGNMYNYNGPCYGWDTFIMTMEFRPIQ